MDRIDQNSEKADSIQPIRFFANKTIKFGTDKATRRPERIPANKTTIPIENEKQNTIQ